MAEFDEVGRDKVSSFVTAVKDGDGMTAARLLQDVGPCGWGQLLKKTTDDLNHGYIANISSFSKIDQDHETLVVYRTVQLASNSAQTNPLASVEGKSCQKRSDSAEIAHSFWSRSR